MPLPEELHSFEDAVRLDAAIPGAIVTGKHALGELTLTIAPEHIVAALSAVKSAGRYERLSSITAVDWHPAEPRFEVVYHLHSVSRNVRLRLKSWVSGITPEIDSAVAAYQSANWYEREVWDLFGIRFRNHPDLRRIQLPDEWEGHPLRKDYPKTGPRV
jgi:NADH-quinone oxidoreductase subunit C